MRPAHPSPGGNHPETDHALTGDLTTTRASFIEKAQDRHELFIEQPNELYSEQNHEAWRKLLARIQERWERYANPRFLEGVRALRFDQGKVPRLEDINVFLLPLTGFRAKAVSGYVPGFIFFDCLRRREFPTTITIRSPDSLDYLPEPDIFHDIAGHVPMHTDPAFADVLVRFGDCAHRAAEIARGIKDPEERISTLTSIIKAMSRFFWFTIEYGLMRRTDSPEQPCVYGSGLLSSYGEIAHCIESPQVQRYPIRMEWVINQGFEIDHFQPLLFVVDSFDHLFDQVGQLEKWMLDGKLSNVAPGDPQISQSDLASFLQEVQ